MAMQTNLCVICNVHKINTEFSSKQLKRGNCSKCKTCILNSSPHSIKPLEHKVINVEELRVVIAGYIRRCNLQHTSTKLDCIYSANVESLKTCNWNTSHCVRLSNIIFPFCLSSTINYKYCQILINDKPHSLLGSQKEKPLFNSIFNSIISIPKYVLVSINHCHTCSHTDPDVLKYHCSYIQSINSFTEPNDEMIQKYGNSNDIIFNNVDEYQCKKCLKYIAINLRTMVFENSIWSGTDSFFNQREKTIQTIRQCSVFGNRQNTLKKQNENNIILHKKEICYECHQPMEILQRNIRKESKYSEDRWSEYINNIDYCKHCDLVHEMKRNILEKINDNRKFFFSVSV